jgi:AcrR family transcriptional regulator
MERVLAAAGGCFQRSGTHKTTMEDVAQASGVSRATVYRYLADREFAGKLIEGLVRNVERGRRDPVVQLLVNSDQPALAARVLGSEGVSHRLS